MMTPSRQEGQQITGWKVLTHDYRPPIQGGDPLWDGTPGAELEADKLDRSSAECAAGLNFTRNPETALRIAGLWPDGRPSILLRVRTAGDWVERGDKCRTDRLIIEREATEAETADAILALSQPFGEHAVHMARSQLDWRAALTRPEHDPRKVARDLRRALKARGLAGWKIKQYRAAWDARDARAAWAERAAWAAWDAWAAWAAWDAWDARAARAARAAWAAWAARAARAAWAAWDAWDARDALALEYAALRGWVEYPPDLRTTGIRDAYRHGLAVAVPTGPKELGYAMEEER